MTIDIPVWAITLLSVAASAVVSGIIGYLIKRSLDKYFQNKDKKEQEQLAHEQELLDLREEKVRQTRRADLEEILKARIDPISERLDRLSDGTLSSLRNDILTCYYRCREKGYRGDWDYTNIHDLYEAYKELHGNSFIDDVMKRFDALPAKEEAVSHSNKRPKPRIGSAKPRSTQQAALRASTTQIINEDKVLEIK